MSRSSKMQSSVNVLSNQLKKKHMSFYRVEKCTIVKGLIVLWSDQQIFKGNLYYDEKKVSSEDKQYWSKG